MNRHERRAAQKQQADTNTDPDFITLLPDASGNGISISPNSQAAPLAKPSFAARLLGKILLSQWVLARIQHPDVERLLINLAIETGRTDIMDELVRRQALRIKL